MKRKYINAAIVLIVITLGSSMSSCTKMEDNYIEYLDQDPYAPKISNLTVVNHLRAITLNWELPETNRLEQIKIEYDDIEIVSDLTNTFYIDGLQIKGYTFKVYTIDKYGFESVPVSIYAFPNGEE